MEDIDTRGPGDMADEGARVMVGAVEVGEEVRVPLSKVVLVAWVGEASSEVPLRLQMDQFGLGHSLQ